MNRKKAMVGVGTAVFGLACGAVVYVAGGGHGLGGVAVLIAASFGLIGVAIVANSMEE